MMSTSGCTPPTLDRSAGCRTALSLRSSIASTWQHDVRRGAVHDRDPVRHVGLQLRREAGEHLRGLRRVHVRQHQGDRLRVLVLHEREHLPGVGLLQERERQVPEHRREPVDDLVGALACRATG